MSNRVLFVCVLSRDGAASKRRCTLTNARANERIFLHVSLLFCHLRVNLMEFGASPPYTQPRRSEMLQTIIPQCDKMAGVHHRIF